MRIDSTPFDATLRQYEGQTAVSEGEAPGEFGPRPGTALSPPTMGVKGSPAAQVPAAEKGPETSIESQLRADEVGVIVPPVAGAAQASPQAVAEAAAQPVSAAAPTTATRAADTKPIWSLRRKPGEAAQPLSAATKPNRQRTMVIAAALFLVGIVVGPWLAQKAIPQPPPAPAPGQSVQAIADTLKASALGLPVPSMPQSGTASLSEAAAAASPASAPLPATGEERYLSMLQALKATQPEAQPPIRVVPRMAGAAPADAMEGRGATRPVAAREAYPAVPITLDIEQDQAARARTGDNLAAQNLAPTTAAIPTGRYLVLRIAPSRDGALAALMVPLGGDPARDAQWVYAGDATADGFAVEGVSARHVVLRSPSGRLVQLVPQS